MKHLKELSIVVLGATGYTGKQCMQKLHELLRQTGHNLTWGIAGRSPEKLKRTLLETGTKTNIDFSKQPITVCNIEDQKSLLEMTQKANLVINCVGPFIELGERVVDACLKTGTHYIDACGEPLFMEKMQLTKDEEAKEKGVYIVNACGFDSIPADLGLVYLADKFDGVLNYMTTYLEFNTASDDCGASDTTWASLVQNTAVMSELGKVRKQLFKAKLPDFKPRMKTQKPIHKSKDVHRWVVPFPGSDKSVMKRTQRYLYESQGKRPIQVDTFLVMKPLNILVYTLFSKMFFKLSQYPEGRKLLLNFPEVFSCGIFSKNPPEAATKNWLFKQTFCGEGWRSNTQCDGPYNRKIVAQVSGRDPGYETTGLFLTASAITLLSEINKLPGKGKGGVYTPGAAFANTSLMRLLNENNFKLDVSIQDNQ